VPLAVHQFRAVVGPASQRKGRELETALDHDGLSICTAQAIIGVGSDFRPDSQFGGLRST
jgi:hypothetical protein